MKNFLKYILIALLSVWITTGIQAQDKRTLTTKVADVLAQFPAKNMNSADQLIQEIIGLGEEGITQFCNMIIPAGTGDDTQARYAIESLAVYSGAPEREEARKLVAGTFLRAIEKAKDNEVKTFFIERLKFCGGDESIAPLARLLDDEKLYAPAVSMLTSIGY